ncbi:O-acetyl-ADP-ribose deacetylase [Rufibacter sp. LB8]|uniref:O-acetyl-ADP-ribose deacetylase n=1 Tax=Rufibacter sp. LB8 TaxID=2777781 RepID=UPI00178C5D4F|nr:O-acetyl-ADP-ribose deacetylase [Rufibacter sp. LB8]
MATSNRILLQQGDITKITVDAIVNAANSSLLGGGGVDGAIHRAGGPAILAECQQIRARQGGCATGAAVITTAGNLPAQYVIHTVGPVWNGGHRGEAVLLATCYRNSLLLAQQHNLKTIAFPNISTGVYGYPKDKAAQMAVQTVKDFLEENELPEQVTFVVFDAGNLQLYERLL